MFKRILFRNISITICVLSILLISGCNNTKLLTYKDTERNYQKYKAEIETYCNENKLNFNTIRDDFYGCFNDIIVTTNDSDEIDISIRNFADENNIKDTGQETFSVTYSKSEKNKFDIDVFVDLVNIVSGRKIDKEYCLDFINSTDDKYRITPSEYEKECKVKYLNFWGDWCIFYTLNDDDTEELEFCGLTENGSR